MRWDSNRALQHLATANAHRSMHMHQQVRMCYATSVYKVGVKFVTTNLGSLKYSQLRADLLVPFKIRWSHFLDFKRMPAALLMVTNAFVASLHIYSVGYASRPFFVAK